VVSGTGRPRVVLIGPPGSGKTTVGEQVASRLGLALRDTDRAIEEAAGRSISEIFVEDGEAAFRALERREVQTSLARHEGVLSLGGGSVLDEDTQRLLAGHTVVYLQVGIADAAKRVGFDRSRPLLALQPRAAWVRLMDQRRGIYERLAVHCVDTAGRTPEDIAAEIVTLLEDTP
jgi:shikimate kinase